MSHPRLVRVRRPVVLLFVLVLVAGMVLSARAPEGPQAAPLPTLDSARLMADVFRLSHDSMGGRGVMTSGNARARDWLVAEFGRLGLDAVEGGYAQPFVVPRRNGGDSLRGTNVLGFVRGRVWPDRWIVVSAHFDHLGTRGGRIFNGADDNASGTAAVLAAAAYTRAHAPRHSILFALWDAEEPGLVGARAFVARPPVPLSAIAANVNLDMVSRNDKGELYAAGATPWPRFRPILDSLIPDAAVTLRLGHDSGGGHDDWTEQSDHGAFHAVRIPFIYFGVEDHPDYHQPTDDPERIDPGFYYRAVRTIMAFVERLDRDAEPRER